MEKRFGERLANAVRAKKNQVMVGIDPRWNLLPEVFTAGKDASNLKVVVEAFESFGRAVIDIVAPWVPVVKPQAAFFEQCGPWGMVALGNLIRYASEKGLLVVLDGKRNDIGSTASAYAAGILGKDSPWGADALTVSPYLGDDSLAPFIDTARERRAGIFILVKTSNPGGGMFQDLVSEGRTLYQRVADYVASFAQGNSYSDVGAVVGATWPEQLKELRARMPKNWLLIPGYGSQGGGAKDVASAFDQNGLGAVINNSRGILFAHRSGEYAQKYGESKWEGAVEASTRAMIAALNEVAPVK